MTRALAREARASISAFSSSSSSTQSDLELGNKCGKCQNHELEVSKKGESVGRTCPKFVGCHLISLVVGRSWRLARSADDVGRE